MKNYIDFMQELSFALFLTMLVGSMIVISVSIILDLYQGIMKDRKRRLRNERT